MTAFGFGEEFDDGQLEDKLSEAVDRARGLLRNLHNLGSESVTRPAGGPFAHEHPGHHEHQSTRRRTRPAGARTRSRARTTSRVSRAKVAAGVAPGAAAGPPGSPVRTGPGSSAGHAAAGGPARRGQVRGEAGADPDARVVRADVGRAVPVGRGGPRLPAATCGPRSWLC